MKTISVSEAFSLAPPRRPAVLCIKGPNGSTDMIMTSWFNWLNMRRQPMISYAMERTRSLGLNAAEMEEVYLAFPPVNDALRYQNGVRTAAEGEEKALPNGVSTCHWEGIPVEVPEDCDVILRCTVEGSYNYPFKKVRIFNCNLEEALYWRQK